MRRLAPVVAVALGGCNLVFGLEQPGGGGDDDGVAIDARADGDGVDGPDGGGGGVVTMLAAGADHTCVVQGGRVRCWGAGSNGKLGGGTTDNIGDDEPASAAVVVAIEGEVIALAAGGDHTCAIVDGGRLYCWGSGQRGRLGYGNTNDIGDNEAPSSAGFVPLNAMLKAVAAGGQHTCGVTKSGALMCWGANSDGRLGYGNLDDIGDTETPASAGTVSGPPEALNLATGGSHTCATDSSMAVSCWGSGANGRLGYGNINDIGDNELPVTVGMVPLGVQVVQLVAGDHHTCALSTVSTVHCWGAGGGGRLGHGNASDIGDNESPGPLLPVDHGGTAIQLAAGGAHTCALLDNGAVRCWGTADKGQLGYGNTVDVGDTGPPEFAGDVPLDGVAVAITAGLAHTCALMASGEVYCWGAGTSGQLGHGNTNNIGDDETAASAGPVPLD